MHGRYCIQLGLLAAISLAAGALWAQAGDYESMLRDEISQLEARMKQADVSRQGATKQLQDYERQLELRRRLIRELEAQSRNSSERVEQLTRKIRSLERDIEELGRTLGVEEAKLADKRREIGARLAILYHRLSGDRLTLLFGSENLNDLIQRRQYLRSIEQYDRARFRSLKEQRDKVYGDRELQENARAEYMLDQARKLSELERVRNLIASKRAEEKQLQEKRAEKSRLLERITGDTELLRALLEERREALLEIEREINRIERAPTPPRQDWKPGQPFASLKGKLPWPLNRREIINPFGRIKHEKLGTTTMNPGIDLKAAAGDPVFAVAAGQVTRIAWLRGFGNTVILEHGDGYYSVYARLGAIRVSEGDAATPGQLVGEVGDVGVGGDFHFEIWAKRESQNPTLWLKSR